LKILILSAAALALAACGPKVEVKDHGDSVTVTGPGGQVVTAGKNAPTNLPEFATLYPGAEVVSNVNMGKNGIVTFSTPATPDAVMAYYKTAAAGAKLATEGDITSGGPDSARIATFKGEGDARQLAVTAKADGGKTMVVITYTAP
jgi:hypothetical protein